MLYTLQDNCSQKNSSVGGFNLSTSRLFEALAKTVAQLEL